MKIFFTLLFLTTVLSLPTFSQCNPAIPAGAVVISTTQTGTGSSKIYWVCNGATLTTSGLSCTMYLEPGASVKSGGIGDVIYAPSGGTVITASGIGVTIYYVDITDIISATGTGAVKTPCASITYDYTNAPSNGCPLCISGGIDPASISSSTGTSFCVGTSTTLTQSGGVLNPGAHWSWSQDSCKGAVIGTGDSVIVSPTATTTYFVQAVGDSCHTKCKSITLSSSSVVAPVIYGTPSLNICNGQPVTLDIVNGPCVGGTCTYVWSNGSTGLSIVVTPTGPTTYTVTITNGCGTSVTGTVDICGGNPTGVASLSNTNDGIVIMPNPSHGVFTVSMPAGIEKPAISIYDMLGNEISFIAREVIIAHQYKNEITVSRKSRGIYFIRIATREKTSVSKLIIDSE